MLMRATIHDVVAILILLQVPKRGVELAQNVGSPFATAFEVNLGYVNQFPVDDMLYWFRRRAGVTNPAGATSWGWDGRLEPFADHDHNYRLNFEFDNHRDRTLCCNYHDIIDQHLDRSVR